LLRIEPPRDVRANSASNLSYWLQHLSEKQRQETLKQSVHNLEVSTRGQSLYEVTSTISEWGGQQSMRTGLLTIFCRHASASLLIQENADPTVRSDIEAYFDRLAPGP
jgi:hypothetical protein